MKKTTIIWIVVVNVILIGSIIALYFTVWKSDQELEVGYLTITGIGEDIKLSIDDLQSLPNISKEYTLEGSGTTIIVNYTGVSVYYLLTEIANITSKVNVKVIPTDNYDITFPSDDFNNTRDCIIAYMKNGQYLKNYRQGGFGPLRLIFPQSYDPYNAQFCVKFVVALEITPIT